MTHEVQLSRPFREGATPFKAASIIDYSNAAIECWFKEELEWCSERNITVTTEMVICTWSYPDHKQIKDIVHNGLAWSGYGPPVRFTFEDDDDALFFKLTWA